MERPISVCTLGYPEWLRAVLTDPGVEECELGQALAHSRSGLGRAISAPDWRSPTEATSPRRKPAKSALRATLACP